MASDLASDARDEDPETPLPPEEQISSASANPYRHKKRLMLLLLLANCLCMGGLSVLPISDIVPRALQFVFLAAAVTWCLNDAYEREYLLSRGFIVFLVLLMVAAFPIYLFRTRGMLGGLKSLFFTGLFFLAMIATAGVGAGIVAAVGITTGAYEVV